MRSVTASYWIPVQVEEPERDLEYYTGFTDAEYEPVEDLMERVIEDMTQIYGNIAGMYYVVESADVTEESGCHFHLEVVITGIVAGDSDADRLIENDWPVDIAEWFQQRWNEDKPDGLIGYDLNPMLSNESMSTYNGTW